MMPRGPQHAADSSRQGGPPKNPHPNATVSVGSGVSGGLAVVYLLSLLGIHVDAYVGGLVASAVSGLVLLVGREGARGLLRRVWTGGK